MFDPVLLTRFDWGESPINLRWNAFIISRRSVLACTCVVTAIIPLLSFIVDEVLVAILWWEDTLICYKKYKYMYHISYFNVQNIILLSCFCISWFNIKSFQVIKINALWCLFMACLSFSFQRWIKHWERERERERPINIKRRQFISEQKLCWTRFCEHTSDHGDLALGDRESLSRECWDGGLWGVGRHGVDDLSWEATERCGGDDTSIRHGRGRCDLQQHVKYSLFFCKVTTYLHVFHICVHKFFHFASKTDSFRLVFLGF